MTTPIVTKAVKAAAAGRVAPAGGSERGGRPRAAMRAATKPAAVSGRAAPTARKAPPASRKAQPSGGTSGRKASSARSARTSAAARRYARGFTPAALKAPTDATKIIAAEYAACVVLVGVTPILTRKPTGQGHVYAAGDFVRLSALSLLYFILALMSGSPRTGRVAAAFGGLVSLGVLFNARGAINAIGTIFANAKNNGGVVATASAGTSTVDAPTFTPVDLAGNPLTQAGSTASTPTPASGSAST